jgi:hypothetical protein
MWTHYFGDSEDNDWRSLMKVDGITEDVAKELHTKGIEAKLI